MQAREALGRAAVWSRAGREEQLWGELGAARLAFDLLVDQSPSRYRRLADLLKALCTYRNTAPSAALWSERFLALSSDLELLADDPWAGGHALVKLARWFEGVSLEARVLEELQTIAADGAFVLAGAETAWGRQLARTGRFTAAASSLQAAISRWRAQSGEAPNRLTHRLADALNTYGAVELRLGRLSEAMQACSEAERMLGDLAQMHRTRHLGAWASTLHNVAGILLNAGWAEAAFGSARKAVELRRELAATSASGFNDDLAESLSGGSLAASVSGAGDTAMAWASEAAALLRPLATMDHETFGPRLAAALHNLGQEASRQRRHDEALDAFKEEIALLQGFVDEDEGVARKCLAEVLQNTATLLFARGDLDDALYYVQRAISALEALVAAEPGVFSAPLASARELLQAIALQASQITQRRI